MTREPSSMTTNSQLGTQLCMIPSYLLIQTSPAMPTIKQTPFFNSSSQTFSTVFILRIPAEILCCQKYTNSCDRAISLHWECNVFSHLNFWLYFDQNVSITVRLGERETENVLDSCLYLSQHWTVSTDIVTLGQVAQVWYCNNSDYNPIMCYLY